MATKTKIRTTENVLKEQQAQAKAEKDNALAVKANSNALVADESNPWLEIAAELDRLIGAPYLKFSKQGEFAISDTETLPAGTRCVAHTDEIMFGWRKWQDNKVVETRMGRVADRFVPPQRQDLGDTDEDEWELQDDGSRKDPWQFTASVPLIVIPTGAVYLFSVASKGGLRCINAINRAYGARMNARGRTWVCRSLKLHPDSYKHPRYGKIFVPVLHVVNWTGADGKPLSLKDDLSDDLSDDLKAALFL